MASALKKSLHLFFFTTVLLGSLAQSAPQRVVSLSLCTDQLLLLLITDKSRIASISYLSANPEFSYLSNETTGIPLNRGQAEEVLAYNPDLILTSQFSATATVNLLKRLGHEVSVVGFPSTMDDTYKQIREVASLVEEDAAGEALISKMQGDINQILAQVLQNSKPESAAFYSANGFSYGSSTLRNSFLNSFGLRNVAADSGMIGSGQLSLETMLIASPNYLLVDEQRAYSNLLAHPMLQHPVFKKAFAPETFVTLPDTLFQCAGPSLVEAYSIMAKALLINHSGTTSGNHE